MMIENEFEEPAIRDVLKRLEKLFVADSQTKGAGPDSDPSSIEEERAPDLDVAVERARLYQENIAHKLDILTLRAELALARREIEHLRNIGERLDRFSRLLETQAREALQRERQLADRLIEQRVEPTAASSVWRAATGWSREEVEWQNSCSSTRNDGESRSREHAGVRSDRGTRTRNHVDEPWWERVVKPETAKGAARFVRYAARGARVASGPELHGHIDDVAHAASRVLESTDSSSWITWADELSKLVVKWFGVEVEVEEKPAEKRPSGRSSAPRASDPRTNTPGSFSETPTRIDTAFTAAVEDRGQRIAAENSPRRSRRRRRQSRGALLGASPGVIRVRRTNQEVTRPSLRNEPVVDGSNVVSCRLDLEWMRRLVRRSGLGSRTAREVLLPCLYKYAGDPIVGSVEVIGKTLKLKCSVETLGGALKIVASCSSGVTEVKPAEWRIDPELVDMVSADGVSFEVVPRSA